MKKETATNKIDMLQGPLLKKTLLFAIPLALSSILQQLFNSVDVAVLGRFVNSQAQAAVGCDGPVINLFLNMFIGISVGANVVIGGYIGEGREEKIQDTVHTSMTIAILSGMILLVVGLFIAKPIVQLIGAPADVFEHAVQYLRIYFFAMPFIVIYNFGSAILRSTGDTKRPMYCLMLAGVINACINLFLVIVCHMGVAGVAIGTVISNMFSAGLVCYFLMKEEGNIQLLPSRLGLTGSELKKVLKIGVPAALQTTIFTFSNVCLQTAINGYGSSAVAATAITLNYEFITYFVVVAFNQATITFTSQNYGAGQYKRCRKIFRMNLLLSALSIFALSSIILWNNHFFLSIFTSNPEVIEYAKIRMYCVLGFNVIATSYELAGSALRGMGYSLTPALITMVGTCLLRIGWITILCPRIPGFKVLLSVYPVSWVITGIAVVTTYVIIQQKYKKIETRRTKNA